MEGAIKRTDKYILIGKLHGNASALLRCIALKVLSIGEFKYEYISLGYCTINKK